MRSTTLSYRILVFEKAGISCRVLTFSGFYVLFSLSVCTFLYVKAIFISFVVFTGVGLYFCQIFCKIVVQSSYIPIVWVYISSKFYLSRCMFFMAFFDFLQKNMLFSVLTVNIQNKVLHSIASLYREEYTG